MNQALLTRVRLASLDDCKAGWDFFDDRMDGDTMTRIVYMASRGVSTRELYETVERCLPALQTMHEDSRYALALCMEYAVRTRGQAAT